MYTPRVRIRKQGLLVLLLRSLSVFSLLTNRTIDDTYGDSVTGLQVVYTSNWNAGQTCSGCAVHPDKSEAYLGTWHDTTSNNPNSTSPHSATLKFNGTAIWVYCILVNSANHTGDTIFTNVSFEVDGALVTTYSHIPDPTADQYLYNITALSKTGLSIAEHTLMMTAVEGSEPSLLLFDWAMYTFDNGEPSPTSTAAPFTSSGTGSPPTNVPDPDGASTPIRQGHGLPAGAIAGGVIGGVAFILLFLFLLMFMRRRRMMHLDPASAGVRDMMDRTAVDPFVSYPANRNPHAAGSLRAQHVGSVAPISSVTAPTTSSMSPISYASPTTAVQLREKRVFKADRSHHEDLIREVDELRQQFEDLQVERSFMYTESVAATSVSAPVSSRSIYSDTEAELRRELGLLRVEMARIRAETQRAVELPPAYV